MGIEANKSPCTLSESFKEALRKKDTRLLIILYSEGVWDIIIAEGSERLILSDTTKMIVRKSEYVDAATIGIKANKSAADIDRRLVQKLRKGGELYVVMIVYSGSISP